MSTRNAPTFVPTHSTATHRWLRIGIGLVVVTMVYNVIEACVGLWAGVEAESIALVGFGLDSIIELMAASFLLWRLRIEAKGANPSLVEQADQRVHRFVGLSFLTLAVYVSGQAGWMLWQQQPAAESSIGILLALASLIIMPFVSLGKLRAATQVGSRALRAEAKETLACSYLSFTLLLGLSANASMGWWWADPVAALLMVPWLLKEGVAGLGGRHATTELQLTQTTASFQ